MTKTVNILLVEDEMITAMLMRKELRRFGYTVNEHVTTGEDAVESARENRPDLILMDITLAGEMDGISAAAQIKKEADIPVIFITGYPDPKTRERAEETSPLAYLIKPIQMSQLRTLIDSRL